MDRWWILIEDDQQNCIQQRQKKSDKKCPHYDGDLPDYHASGHYQYNWKWTDPLTEGSGCKLIRKQLRPVYRRRWYAKEVERRAEISDIGIMCTDGILKGNENGGFVSADETVRKMLPYNQELC